MPDKCQHYWPPDQPTVGERLAKLGELYTERNAIYGDDYKRHGDIMMTLFPEGIKLDTAEDFNRYAVFQQLATKLSRYAAQWSKGGHADSLNDLSVYAQMLQELDAAWRELYTIGETLPKRCGAHVLTDGIRYGCQECDISWSNVNLVKCLQGR